VITCLDNSLLSADKDRQESRAVTEKPHVVVVKFATEPPYNVRLTMQQSEMSIGAPEIVRHDVKDANIFGRD